MNQEGIPNRKALSEKRRSFKAMMRAGETEHGVEEMRNRLLIEKFPEYIGRFVRGRLPNAKDYEATKAAQDARLLAEEKKSAQEAIRAERAKFPSFRVSGEFFEDALRKNQLPRVVVSEDASGRFMALVLRRFLNRVHAYAGTGADNVPVLSYSVGRASSDESAQQEAERIQTLLTKRHQGEPVVIATDVIETGQSIRPLLTTLGFDRNTLTIALSTYTAHQRALDALQLPEGSLVYTPGDMSSKRYGLANEMRSVERQFDTETQTKDVVIAAEIPADRPIRVDAVEAIADAMYDEFLKRPGVAAFLKERKKDA